MKLHDLLCVLDIRAYMKKKDRMYRVVVKNEEYTYHVI